MVNSYKEDKSAPFISDINGNKTKVLGHVMLNVNIGLKPDSPHFFYVIDSNNPFAILGLDFIINRNLTIIPQEKIIAQTKTGIKLKLKHLTNLPRKSKTLDDIEKLLTLFPEIEKEPNYNEKPKHNHELDIDLEK